MHAIFHLQSKFITHVFNGTWLILRITVIIVIIFFFVQLYSIYVLYMFVYIYLGKCKVFIHLQLANQQFWFPWSESDWMWILMTAEKLRLKNHTAHKLYEATDELQSVITYFYWDLITYMVAEYVHLYVPDMCNGAYRQRFQQSYKCIAGHTDSNGSNQHLVRHQVWPWLNCRLRRNSQK